MNTPVEPGTFHIIEGVATPLWVRVLPYIAVLLVVAASLYGAYSHGVTVTNAKYKAIIAQSNLDHANEIISLNGRIAAAEHKAGQVMAAIDQSNLESQKNVQQIAAAAVANYRAGVVRLRDEFTPHISPSAGVSSAATSTGQCDATCTGGLQPKHVEFFVHEASRADQAVKQLAACQAVVRADRAVVVGP